MHAFSMNKLGYFAVCAMLKMGICVAQDLVNIVHGTIKKVDSTTKTIVVKTADGMEHTIKVTDAATVKGTKEGFNGLKEGTQIVARTTGKGADETAMEVGQISKDGFKASHGTVEKFDKDTKTIVVKDVHGAKKTFELSGKALEDAGKATGTGIARHESDGVLHGRGRGESSLLCFKLKTNSRSRNTITAI
jgi:hypothetical protein